MFLGFYSYTVILTYLGLFSSVIGMTMALEGHFHWAIACLVTSGICDMLDGKIARSKKNRTEDEKTFGIQIDSLCDLVCFSVFPAFLGYGLGLRGFWGTTAMCLFVLAGVIRLGYFNVMEQKRQQETSEARKYYQGLPVTSIAIIFPMVFLLRPYIGVVGYLRILIAVMLTVALLNISNIKVPKPDNKMITCFILLALVIIGKLLRLY
ncbi:MAG: CDP-alcohol phosphatidyltransferase family protein [Lachnospiraceae bacterium]|nr:CDP-alcohol phosphatidyltransferase family protein [Lachnospiraceae bacterium]MDD3796155.1 CDP-alcohol phosphatidyltransferase family protein [Lachnospiraceae bacterium]